jgi:proline dehydrogenase
MGLMRNLLLRGSRSVWLREKAMRRPFVRRSVSRFMPGERLDDALQAAKVLQDQGTGTILTHLGENLVDASEAEIVTRHYLEVLDRIQGAGLDTRISIKLTQLGLDFDAALCQKNLVSLARRAEARGNLVWIDMESSDYVDRTLEQYRSARAESAKVGICLQAYLRRTAADLEALLPLGPAVRLVKGAYQEPAQIAFARKSEVDDNFYALATRLLSAAEAKPEAFLGVGTHDGRLQRRIEDFVARARISPARLEYEMLFGIQRGLQQQLVAAGRRLRVLISYGEYWFPWYMRRLAERPANVLFVAKSMLSR